MTISGDVVRRRSVVPSVVLGLTLFFCAALSLILGLLIYQGYFATITQTREDAQSAAHIVSVHAEWLIDGTNQSLRRIDDVIGVDVTMADVSTSAIRQELAGLPADAVWIGIYDPTGARISGDPTTPESIVGDAYFDELRGGLDWQISSLILDTPAAPRFALSRRLERNGSFAGAAVVFVSASIMADFWASLDFADGSTVSLVRTDGWLIARHPSPSAALNLIDYELFTVHYAAAENGSYLAERSPADGMARTVGYRRIADLPVLALASIATDSTVSGFWRAVWIVVAMVAPLILLLAGGAIWLAGVMRRDERNRLQLAQAIEDNKTLMREIHHRVKNNLQAVSSLVQLQPIPAPAKLEMSRRIQAMVSVHEHIYRSDQFANAQVDDYIKVIVEHARQGFDSPVEITMNLEPLMVDKEHAMPLGLVVSEVVSNAFKHAFADGRPGRLDLSLVRHGDNQGRLTISDDGPGFDTAAKTQGMGRRLIEGLVRQLEGEYRFESDNGTRFVVDFPITGDDQSLLMSSPSQRS